MSNLPRLTFSTGSKLHSSVHFALAMGGIANKFANPNYHIATDQEQPSNARFDGSRPATAAEWIWVEQAAGASRSARP
jgi:hypothetical protein